MIRHNEIWNASLKYTDEHPSDYTNEMYDIVDIEKAFKAGAEWADATTWKPTIAQMKALDSAIDEFDGYQEFGSLVSLKKDLEKLKKRIIITRKEERGLSSIDETAEAFARIIRANLTGIDRDVQYKFEQLYKEITGEKMYQGYKD